MLEQLNYLSHLQTRAAKQMAYIIARYGDVESAPREDLVTMVHYTKDYLDQAAKVEGGIRKSLSTNSEKDPA